MGCACHNGKIISIKDQEVLAYDQCLFCAMKHLTTAWSLWNEFHYQDINLAATDGQLRLCINHLLSSEIEFCEKVRAIAVKIEKRELDKINSESFEELILELQGKIYEKFPEMKLNK